MKWQQDLIKDIRTHNLTEDDKDIPNYPPDFKPPTQEFSKSNTQHLKDSFLNVKDTCKSILEIGVCRNGIHSSTNVFIDNKKHDTIYLGVDLEDKSFLNNEQKNQYTIQTDSSNYNDIISYFNSLGHNSIDYLFIDGWHSINQVLQDWELTNCLSEHGIVGFHDISYHPGPHRFIRSLDLNKWEVDICCNSKNDWGIGFVKRICR